MSNVRASKSGLSRDTHKKIQSKYDKVLALECLEWLRETANESLEDGDYELEFDTDGSPGELYNILRDGCVLARVINSLMPCTIPHKKYAIPSKLAFKHMELIELFIIGCKEFGVSDHDVFQTCDLYEQQNLPQVLTCIQALGRKARSKGFSGIGPKESDENRRIFSDEQVIQGKQVISLQMGSNKGASQAGMTFGKQRMILD
ncbi:unnamed protein product [Owenia fusiformis]|uniref:Transgelin n=1 Tax=Owenia fusiformis TaxID=6347 RepID=A0A8J1TED2_OWEFU|nr:unnamed protein product [Owenia fusiformis]